jgi:hypothetical protein
VSTEYGRGLEAPHDPPPGSPLWSENYAWVAYDPAAGAGVLLHLGRMPHHPELWRSTAVAYLPGERLVVTKAVAPSPAGALGNGNLSLTCERPLHRWHLRFVGMGRPTSRAELARGRVVDGGLVGLDIDLAFDAMTPIWDLGAMHSLGETHYEQHGRYSGMITADGVTHGVDATGYRDHSTGARDLAGFGGHVWTHALFPSGRAFTAFRVYTPDGGTVLNDGVVITGDTLTPTAPIEVPVLTDALGGPETVTIALPDSPPITGQVLHGVPVSLGEPNDFHLGYDPRLGRKVMLDCPARFEWDGEVAHGWLERSTTLPG